MQGLCKGFAIYRFPGIPECPYLLLISGGPGTPPGGPKVVKFPKSLNSIIWADDILLLSETENGLKIM